MANHLFLPLIVPLLSAALSVMLRDRRPVARTIAVLASGFNLAYSAWLLVLVGQAGRQITQADNWAAPYGISLVADGLSAIMLFLTALLCW
jgi:multicomponent Na+:H+ antiporter subunit D